MSPPRWTANCARKAQFAVLTLCTARRCITARRFLWTKQDGHTEEWQVRQAVRSVEIFQKHYLRHLQETGATVPATVAGKAIVAGPPTTFAAALCLTRDGPPPPPAPGPGPGWGAAGAGGSCAGAASVV
jgi:hypothetical protein